MGPEDLPTAPLPAGPPPAGPLSTPAEPYAELHAHSHFSFLDGASHPEELVTEAARLGLEALALTDHDGMYGAVRFAEAAAEQDVRTIFGSELNLGLPAARSGTPDPGGQHLLVLARDPTGYSRLCREISTAQLAGGEKGLPSYDPQRLAAAAEDHWLVLTGCRKGAVRSALETGGVDAAAGELDRLVGLFGRGNVAVELTDTGIPGDSARNDALFDLAERAGVSAVASTGAHLASPRRGRISAALAAIRARSSLDDVAGWLPAWSGAYLRSGAEMAERFARYPGVVRRAAELGRECAFDLRLVAPQLPLYDVPEGHTAASWLRERTWRGAERRYGPPG